MFERLALIFGSLVLMAPMSAHAQSLSQIVGLFNVLVGLLIVAAFLTFVGGYIVYLVRYGNENREEGLEYMEWGVVILFVLVILIAIVKVVQNIFV